MADEAGGGQAAGGPRAAGMFSPVGYIVILLLLLADAAIVWYLTKNWAGAKPTLQTMDKRYEQVDLGLFQRRLHTVPALREKVTLQIVLVLNPVYGDLNEVKNQVERRKDQLRSIIFGELIMPRNEEEFYKPNFLKNFAREIKRHLNQVLGYSGDGHEIINDVLFPQIDVPVKR